jgi:hypothetical protein
MTFPESGTFGIRSQSRQLAVISARRVVQQDGWQIKVRHDASEKYNAEEKPAKALDSTESYRKT